MNINERRVIAAGPDEVWSVAGDAAAIADWVPALESSSLDGDLRHAVFAGGGGEAYERILSRDDAARSYDYEYVSGPLALERYVSRLSVAPHPDGAEVTWTSEFTAATMEEEAQLAEAIAGIYRAGLDDLASRWPASSS